MSLCKGSLYIGSSGDSDASLEVTTGEVLAYVNKSEPIETRGDRSRQRAAKAKERFHSVPCVSRELEHGRYNQQRRCLHASLVSSSWSTA